MGCVSAKWPDMLELLETGTDYHVYRRRQGGPTINWSTIQEKFRSDDTNVLLFIDCCFAAQAARDPERLVPHKVELLAAAGMGTETVPPGPGSFTTACIREMRYLICEHGYISISDLNTRLTRKEACLSVTPFHVFIKSGYGDRSIRLYPCDQGSSQVVAVRHPEAALKLLVFLKEKSLPTMSEFVKQLVDDLHPDVAGIVVDEYVTGAERVQESFPDQLPKAQKRRSETWKPQLGQRYTLEQERESAFSVRKAHLNPSASVAAALDQVTYLLGKLTPALEFIEHTCSSKPQTTKSNKPLQWLSRLSTMEEDVKSFQLEQRNCNEPMNTIQEKSCVMRCKEKTTEQWIAEDVGTVQEEDVEEGAEDDEEQEENDVLSMYPTTTPARKQETLRSIYRTDSLDKDFQSSEGASSDYTRTPSDYTIKPTCATTSSNPTRTPSLTYSVSGHSLEIEGRVRSTDALPEYAEKGEDKISRILAGIHITDSGSAVLYEDIEDDCLKK